jgi:hypothetical protein
MDVSEDGGIRVMIASVFKVDGYLFAEVYTMMAL